jgi:hypothetical protein
MRFLFLSFLAISISFCAKSQSNNDEQMIFDAVDRLRLAMVSGDELTLNKLTAAGLSYGHSSGKIEDKASFVNSIVSGKSDFVSIELKNQTVKILNQTAIVRHQLHAFTNDGGKPGEVNLGILLIWQKEKKQWKLVARQAYKLP